MADLGAISNLEAEVERLIANSLTGGTKRVYGAYWRTYLRWCQRMKLVPIPASPETVALFVAAAVTGKLGNGRRKESTVLGYLNAVRHAHAITRHPDPTKHARVTDALAGARRVYGTAQAPKAPLLTSQVQEIAAILPATLTGVRDRAILLFGQESAMRRSELAALQVSDLDFGRYRLVVRLLRSKTNQEGHDERIRIARVGGAACPVAALEAWLRAADIRSGPVFRAVRGTRVSSRGLCDKAVSLIVKRHVGETGLGDPRDYAGHSLRRGYATSRALAGDDSRTIRKRLRHRSDRMVERYIHDAEFADVETSPSTSAVIDVDSADGGSVDHEVP